MTVHTAHTTHTQRTDDLTGQRVLVVGGCVASARTAGRLDAAGAVVTVISPDLCQDMIDLLVERRVAWERREVEDVDLLVPSVVFGVSDRPRRHPRPGSAHRQP